MRKTRSTRDPIESALILQIKDGRFRFYRLAKL